MASLPSARQPLQRTEMRAAIDCIVGGHVPASDVAEFLRTLAQRGETDHEIAGVVDSLWDHQVRQGIGLPFSSSQQPELCDTCGTGGDHQGTFNISTLAAIVAAACGVRICKHGNRAASSRCGSADVLEALGLHLNANPPQIVRSIEEVGFGFCFAPNFHPAMKVVAPIRKALGIRTIFNLAGPLANPARRLIAFQLVGVSEKERIGSMAGVLQQLAIHHGLVVHSADGLDEVTTTGETFVAEFLKPSRPPLKLYSLLPMKYKKFSPATLDQLRGGDISTNARIAHNVLSNTATPQQHDVVVFNAGCVIYTANKAATIEEGIDQALGALKTGRALKVLQDAIKISHDAGRNSSA